MLVHALSPLSCGVRCSCCVQDGKIVYPEFGVGTGEGDSRGNCPTHKIKIINHYVDQVIEVEVPEDRCVGWQGRVCVVKPGWQS